MKVKTIWFFSGVLLTVFIIIWVIVDNKLGELIETSNVNLKNINKVKVGMSVDSLFLIMGEPENIQLLENQNKSYWYVHFVEEGDYATLRVFVDSTGLVYEIFNPRVYYMQKK